MDLITEVFNEYKTKLIDNINEKINEIPQYILEEAYKRKLSIDFGSVTLTSRSNYGDRRIYVKKGDKGTYVAYLKGLNGCSFEKLNNLASYIVEWKEVIEKKFYGIEKFIENIHVGDYVKFSTSSFSNIHFAQVKGFGYGLSYRGTIIPCLLVNTIKIDEGIKYICKSPDVFTLFPSDYGVEITTPSVIINELIKCYDKQVKDVTKRYLIAKEKYEKTLETVAKLKKMAEANSLKF